MPRGYDWLLGACGQPSMSEHAAHLDDGAHEPGCGYCQRHEGCNHEPTEQEKP